jgi:hypothetical protein
VEKHHLEQFYMEITILSLGKEEFHYKNEDEKFK